MKKISIIILLLVAVLASCKKTPEVNLKYVDVERDLITVGTTTATIQCDYEYIATLKKAFLYYCEGADTINMSIAEMSVVQKTLYVELSGLKENITYSYYYQFANGFNSMRSATKTFKTEASPVTPPEITLPTVVTAEVTEITSNSAQCGGEVTNDGGAEVTERGICWSTSANPTISDSHVSSGNGIGTYAATITGLNASTTYHIRAYATNEKGTAYGLDREFTTLSGGGGSGDTPTGAINGLFTINGNGDQVYFSQGNLQYQASTNTWRFAENQWDYVGEANSNISPTYDGWIDLFGWGTSGWNCGNTYYHPWDYNGYSDNGNLYGPPGEYNLTGSYANSDWGYYNAISNGGNTINTWRALTRDECAYLFYGRNTASGIRYAKAMVNNVNGVILLPDDWNSSYYTLSDTNNGDVSYCSNVISRTIWTNTLEAHGAVFMPAEGMRYGTSVDNVGSSGFYWSASYYDNFHAHCVLFHDFTLIVSNADSGGANRPNGFSVRLVQDAN